MSNISFSLFALFMTFKEYYEKNHKPKKDTTSEYDRKFDYDNVTHIYDKGLMWRVGNYLNGFTHGVIGDVTKENDPYGLVLNDISHIPHAIDLVAGRRVFFLIEYAKRKHKSLREKTSMEDPLYKLTFDEENQLNAYEKDLVHTLRMYRGYSSYIGMTASAYSSFESRLKRELNDIYMNSDHQWTQANLDRIAQVTKDFKPVIDTMYDAIKEAFENSCRTWEVLYDRIKNEDHSGDKNFERGKMV